MSSYLVYVCQAVRNRAGLERYWQAAPPTFPKNIDVLAAYTPFEVLDADQDEGVEGVVLAGFPSFEQTLAWFNGDAYVQARKNRAGNDYLGMLVDGDGTPAGNRGAGTPAYVVFVCRDIANPEALDTYWRRVRETLVGQPARMLIDRGRCLILEGQGPVAGVTAYEFPSRDAARRWYDGAAHREVRHHREKGGKYLVVLTEGGVPPAEQRMPHTRAAGSSAAPPGVSDVGSSV
jgi:uncharacterized protein (DUF1330 family)